MDIGRKHDLEDLKQGLKNAPDQVMRGNILKSRDKILKEQHDGWVRSARQRMISEKLKGRQGNVLEVQDTLINRQQRNSSNFGINISQDDWETIFGHKNPS